MTLTPSKLSNVLSLLCLVMWGANLGVDALPMHPNWHRVALDLSMILMALWIELRTLKGQL